MRELLVAGRRRVSQRHDRRWARRRARCSTRSRTSRRRAASVSVTSTPSGSHSRRAHRRAPGCARARRAAAARVRRRPARRPGRVPRALDGVTDPQNLGAVLRSAETAGATGVVLPRHRSARLTPAAVKAAAGAVEHLPIALVSGVPHLLERATRAGVWSVGLDADGDATVFELDVADRPRRARARCRGSRPVTPHPASGATSWRSIPMHGHIESLNVAAAAAVACFEVARRRGR